MAVIKACLKNSDCNEDGICSVSGECICSPGRMGINCQQKLFAKRTAYENKDGSNRCLRFVEPKPIAQKNNSMIRVGIDSWPSQIILSEIAIIILKEIMGFTISRTYVTNDGDRNLQNKGELDQADL